MLETGSRVELNGGIYFYEQDIQFNDYIFTGDVEIKTEIDFLRPGFGFVLMEQEPGRESEGDLCILKVGAQDFSVVLKQKGMQMEPVHTSSPITPGEEEAVIRLVKKGKMLSMFKGGLLLGHYTTDKPYDRFKIGFYSNAGNIIKKIEYVSGAPQRWMVNPHSCAGGRINFIKDGFEIEDCLYMAEVEDDNVPLEPGKYFLDFDRSEVKGKNDIEAFIFDSDDERFDPEKKNLLDKDLSFTIHEATSVAIHFRGTHGRIEKVSIKENPLDGYVPTGSGARTTAGSQIRLKLQGLLRARWRGTIERVPEYPGMDEERDYSVIKVGSVNKVESDLSVNIGEEYTYDLDVEGMRLTVKDSKGAIRSTTSYPKSNVAIIFRNVKGYINEFIVTKDDGEETNILFQKTTKIYVPASVGGPIIVTDKDQIPLDISSSYRVREVEGDELYEFTNWERELFDARKILSLEKNIIDAPGNIIVYGIPKGEAINESAIYHSNSEIDPLPGLSRRYRIIEESEFSIDYYRNSITFKEDPANEYEKLVIEYLKNRSYSVNYREDLHSYEVDISTKEEGIFVMYDYKENEDGTGSVEEYTITGIRPEEGENRFVVLRKE